MPDTEVVRVAIDAEAVAEEFAVDDDEALDVKDGEAESAIEDAPDCEAELLEEAVSDADVRALLEMSPVTVAVVQEVIDSTGVVVIVLEDWREADLDPNDDSVTFDVDDALAESLA